MPNIETLEAFSPAVIAADVGRLENILKDFFARVSPADWEHPTEKNGWTVRQTLIHLASIASLYQRATESALEGTPFNVEHFNVQTDLLTYNKQELARRATTPRDELVRELFQWLETAAQCAASLKPSQLSRCVNLFAYNRPMSVAELLGGQVAHPGLIHGAQLANGLRVAPLWNRFGPDFMCRQITRSLALVSHAYLVERGGNRVARVNLHVRGNGSWHIIMNPQGGDWGEGSAPHPTLTVWFSNADALCRTLTFQLHPLRALLTGKSVALGNVILGFQMPGLFLT